MKHQKITILCEGVVEPCIASSSVTVDQPVKYMMGETPVCVYTSLSFEI